MLATLRRIETMRRRVVCLQPHFAFASFCALPLPEGIIRVCRTAFYKSCAGAGEDLRGCQPRARRGLTPAPPAGGLRLFCLLYPAARRFRFRGGRLPRCFLILTPFLLSSRRMVFFPRGGNYRAAFLSSHLFYPRPAVWYFCPRGGNYLAAFYLRFAPVVSALLSPPRPAAFAAGRG